MPPHQSIQLGVDTSGASWRYQKREADSRKPQLWEKATLALEQAGIGADEWSVSCQYVGLLKLQ